jgi:hypothetical protein
VAEVASAIGPPAAGHPGPFSRHPTSGSFSDGAGRREGGVVRLQGRKARCALTTRGLPPVGPKHLTIVTGGRLRWSPPLPREASPGCSAESVAARRLTRPGRPRLASPGLPTAPGSWVTVLSQRLVNPRWPRSGMRRRTRRLQRWQMYQPTSRERTVSNRTHTCSHPWPRCGRWIMSTCPAYDGTRDSGSLPPVGAHGDGSLSGGPPTGTPWPERRLREPHGGSPGPLVCGGTVDDGCHAAAIQVP